MSNFSVGDAVCVIPDREMESDFRLEFEGIRHFIKKIITDREGCKYYAFMEDDKDGFIADDLIHWDAATPAQRAGLCVGDRIKVNKTKFHCLEEGDIVSLELDDKTSSPYFKGQIRSDWVNVVCDDFTRLLDEPEAGPVSYDEPIQNKIFDNPETFDLPEGAKYVIVKSTISNYSPGEYFIEEEAPKHTLYNDKQYEEAKEVSDRIFRKRYR